MTTLSMRPYQTQWLNAIADAYSSGTTRQLGRAATGLGKTVLFANLPDRLKLSKRALILVHREELAVQAADKIRQWNPTRTVGVEMGANRSLQSDQIVVAGVQSIGRVDSPRLLQFRPDDFGLIVVDEAHHCTGSSYMNVLNHFGVMDRKDLLTLGVTATPNRADGKGLSKIFQQLVFDMPLAKGIGDGWLADIRGFRVKTATDISGVAVTAGDFNQGELASAVNTPARNEQVVNEWLKLCPTRQTVAFCVDVQHAKDLSVAFKTRGVASEAIWGDDPYRWEKLQMHRKGQLTVLVNCQILTEGYDDPSLSCIIIAKPTKSAPLYEQMVGRGTRLPTGVTNLYYSRNDGMIPSKVDCIILDVVDISQKHSLNSVSSLFGFGDMDLKGVSSQKVTEKFEEAAKRGISLDAVTDFEKIDSYVEEVDLFAVDYAPEVVQFSEFQWHRINDGSYLLQLMDKDVVTLKQDLLDRWNVVGSVFGKAFQTLCSTFENAVKEADQLIRSLGGRNAVCLAARHATWHDAPVTQAQKMLCRNIGISIPAGATKGQVSMAINARMVQRADRTKKR